MRIKYLALSLVCITFLSSCVTRKLYNELDSQLKEAQLENQKLDYDLQLLNSSNNDLEKIKRDLAAQLKELQQERLNLNAEIAAAKNRLKDLEMSYTNLEKYSQESLEAEAARLAKAKSDLEQKSKRVEDLESIIEANDLQMRLLRDNLSAALNDFEGRGLTIEQKNGRVYVSMENKLLFKSGSWSINTEGQKAIEELSKVLAQNPDITVVIEGHTDNDKILGNLGEGVKTNWDLSSKRALTIVEIIAKNEQVDKKNLTAAARSQYAPIAENTTTEGKAKNRRIEVILTPNLDKINQMLQNIN
ncbi:OmpA family protein [Myroides sp. LJL115]